MRNIALGLRWRKAECLASLLLRSSLSFMFWFAFWFTAFFTRMYEIKQGVGWLGSYGFEPAFSLHSG